MALEDALILTFKDKLQRDVLIIPSLPEVAMKVCEVIEQDDVSLHDVAILISRDAGMAARMIKISNSALFGTVAKIKTVQDATNRIGLTAIKSIAMAMAMEQLYVSKSTAVFHLLEANWQRAIQVASAATALLFVSSYKRALSKELVTLAGIVHNIGGLPVLFEMEKMPKLASPETIRHVMSTLQSEIGIHLLTVWDFDPDVIEALLHLETKLPTEGPASVADFVVAGSIACDFTLTGEEQAELLLPFIEKGIIKDETVIVSPEYLNSYRDTFSSLSR